MKIGTKIKNARIEANLTQEQSAEALGVSRQTISNWENEKTYPDIVSVIKMSDLYFVSLDHLLKEETNVKQTYTKYLEESTNVVKSKNKLSKIILISAYLIIFAIAETVLWLFGPESNNATVFNIIFMWTLLPITTFILSLMIGNYNYWGKAKWTFPILFGIMLMLIPYKSYHVISSTQASNTFIWPNIWAFFIGLVISLLGIGIGVIFRNKKNKQ